jgi:transcriptional regulator with XRE-family HTH domain
MKFSSAAITGRRLRFFRKRAGLSQFQLEVEIGAASGSISRIENGVTNANKETLNAIADVLEMNLVEREYAYGKRMFPVTQEDIEKALSCVQKTFSKPWYFAYIIDDRYRVWDVSKGMRKFLNLSEEVVNEYLGKSLIKIALDDKLGKRVLSADTYLDTLRDLIDIFYVEVGFMIDDPIIADTITTLEENTVARKMWYQIKRRKPMYLQDYMKRKVKFNMSLVNVPIVFSKILLKTDERFTVIEYSIDPGFR